MQNVFVNHTLAFFERSDLRMRFPEIRPICINATGGLYSEMSACCYLSINSIQDNQLLALMVAFSLLDVLVDIHNPHLVGQSFKYKYNDLPDNSDMDIVFREIYRLFKVLRNATIHAKDSILITETCVNIDYFFNNTHFHVNCGRDTLALLYTLVMLYAELQNHFNKHSEGILRSYYDVILSGIKAFSDEFGDALAPLDPAGLRLKRVRYVMHDASYITAKDGQSIIISKRPATRDEHQTWHSTDYVLKHTGEIYVVPEEIIDPSGVIALNKLSGWSRGPMNSFEIKGWKQLLISA
jgi:hypothetical protein